MTIHQLVTAARGEVLHRSISCDCSPGLNYGCACYDAKHHSYYINSEPISSSNDQSVDHNINAAIESNSIAAADQVVSSIGSAVDDWSNPALIGQYCCVEYDNKPYPGIIRNIDESDVEVQCMHSVGKNRFFWPEKNIDVCWYPFDKVLAIIPEPRKVTSRHQEMDPTVWAAVLQRLAK
jgi:hypothetical protein